MGGAPWGLRGSAQRAESQLTMASHAS